MKRDEILQMLHQIEEDEAIEIIYACEAGSRVWGFENEESDYDIRFIYRKADPNDYISLKEVRDVIEYMGDDLDIVGWDITKALKLFYKDNPNLREWLISSEIYIDKGISDVFDDLDGFDISVLKNHYLAIAVVHWRKYNGLEFDKKKIKKYLYVIRSILTWKLLDKGIYPPININDLLNHQCTEIGEDVGEAIWNLIDYYKDLKEINEETMFIITNFILNSLNSMKKAKVRHDKNFDAYERRFKEIINLR